MTSKKKRKNKLVAISGGFDPIHIGHLQLIRAAAEYGRVVVILNTDQWLLDKKGYYFMTLEERIELLKNIKKVARVVVADDADGTVANTLRKVEPDYFANGGTIDEESICQREREVCDEVGIEMVFAIGGRKVQSSSELVKKLTKKKSNRSGMDEFRDIIDSFHAVNTSFNEK